MQKKTLLLIIILIITMLGGCNTAGKAGPPDGKLIVYTSIYPVTDFTKQIGGDKVEVINLVPTGAQPHSFEPSTKMVAELSKAKLFIYNGAGMEHYLPKLAQTLQGSGVKLVDTSKGIALLSIAEDEASPDEEADQHEHGEYDPHIWLSPTRAAQQSQAIYQALAELDPANDRYYQANLQNLQQELALLDQEYRSILSKCRQKNLVVSHAAFSYLTDDYGLKQVSLMGVNADAEPGPATLKETIRFVQENKLRYVFWDPLDSPKLVQTLAEGSQVTALPLNSIGALNEKELQEGQNYFSMMRANLANLQKGLEYQP